MKVYILGYSGNMAQRYRAILKMFGHETAGYDKKDGLVGNFGIGTADRIIIATPTASHLNDLKATIPYKIPILCEKPFTKDRQNLNEIITFAETHGTKVEMVNQYEWLTFSRERSGDTVYNYFKHGGDSLHWDCINIIYHANAKVELGENSAIWSCRINGDPLSIADMDYAYIRMLEQWTQSPKFGAEHIWNAHEKTRKLEAECKQF